MGRGKPSRPILRYHGGKWKMAPWIISCFPEHNGYVEPYGGAASVLLRKERCRIEVYNDLDQDIFNLFLLLRDSVESKELERQLRLTPFSRDEFDLSYEHTNDPIEKARRFIVRSFFGYGSKALTDIKNGFRSRRNPNSPPAKDWSTYPKQIQLFYERLQGVVIENRPALEVIERYDSEENLIYLDPPYVHSTRNVRTGHYRYEMTDQDHIDLAKAAMNLKGFVVISGYRCELYDDLYGDWTRFDKHTYADKALKRTESIWVSPNCSIQKRLFEVAS